MAIFNPSKICAFSSAFFSSNRVLLTTISLYYSSHTIHERVKEYFALFLLLATGMSGVFVSLDFFLFYIFWEIGLVPMYFLIGIWGGPRREYAAIKFFLYTLAGSVLMLLAILGMYFDRGTFDILELAKLRPFAGNLTLQALAFWGIFAAFAIKVPLWPFHTWLPDAHVEAPPGGSELLAGVLLKMGVYGFLRFAIPLFPEAASWFTPALVALAVTGILYGALISWVQRDLKKLVAYSSVSHLGYCLLGLFAGTAPAVAGSAFTMVSHGLATGLLFFLVGMLYERRHTRMMEDFGGLATPLPRFAASFVVAALASAGLPGLSGFVGEFLVLAGTLGVSFPAAALAALGMVLSALYLLRMVSAVCFGPVRLEENRTLPALSGREAIIIGVLLLALLILGIYPSLLLDKLNPSVVDFVTRYQGFLLPGARP